MNKYIKKAVWENNEKIYRACNAAFMATQKKAMAETVKLGVLLGFTGPIESLNARYGCWC